MGRRQSEPRLPPHRAPWGAGSRREVLRGLLPTVAMPLLNVHPTVAAEPGAPATRDWDAVTSYAAKNSTLLAPRVEEYRPIDPPMDHYRSIADLERRGARLTADLERSNRTGDLQAVGLPDSFLHTRDPRVADGFIIDIPPGEYRLKSFVYDASRSRRNYGARLVFNGQMKPGGSHVRIEVAGSDGTGLHDHNDIRTQNGMSGLEFRNLELRSPETGLPGGPGTYLRYSLFDNVYFSGGFKNAQEPGWHPSVAIYNNCVFTRAGRGDGLTHTFYGSYNLAVVLRNCVFAAPLGEGHPLKCYATQLDMRGCTIANWWHPEEEQEGYYGEQVPCDLGARAQSLIMGCHFVKRGNRKFTRPTPFIDFRNRVYEVGSVDWVAAKDWGTNDRTFDYRSINNEVGEDTEADPKDQRLFRHLVLNNKFFNGVLPDGSPDPTIRKNPGLGLRNNGTIFEWADGSGGLLEDAPRKNKTPSDFEDANERAVIYLQGNEFAGVPVAERFVGPYGHPGDPRPYVKLEAALPKWALDRISRQSGADHWWTESWPSAQVPKL